MAFAATNIHDETARDQHGFVFMNTSHAPPEQSMLELYADMWALMHGQGAVMTLSSSMGRFVYFHNYALSERGHFDFASLDTAKMGGGRRGYVPNPIAA